MLNSAIKIDIFLLTLYFKISFSNYITITYHYEIIPVNEQRPSPQHECSSVFLSSRKKYVNDDDNNYEDGGGGKFHSTFSSSFSFSSSFFLS